MKYIILSLALISLFACTQPQVKYRKEIAEMEKAYKADSAMGPDREKTQKLIKAYIDYADKFQDDSSSGTYLFRAGDLSYRIRQPQQALDYFERMQRYQTNSKTSTALFLQGFIYETEMNDKAKAKTYYEKFLQQYPNHEFADDVRFTLDNLGKSDEELIREFEAKQKQDSVAAK
jgi:tetratricopeptide (TPR) repeat protein